MYCFAGVALLGVTVLWMWRSWRRGNKVVTLAMVWVLAWMLPTVGILPLKHLRADRYLYGALPALIFVGVSLVRNVLVDGTGRGRHLATSLGIAVYVYFAVCFLVRAQRFLSNEALWLYETKDNAACLEGTAYLAREAYNHGHADLAEARIERVLRASPTVVAFRPMHEMMYYLGLIRLSRGDTTGAFDAFHEVLQRGSTPRLRSEAAYSLALMEYGGEQFVSMSRYLDEALALKPSAKSVADVYLLSSYGALRLSRFAECERYYKSYLHERPSKLSAGRRALMAEIELALQEWHPSAWEP